jgi:sporulation protein YlmC with PRC-barrel domain
MDQIKALNVAGQLRGMPVIVPDRAQRLGQVSDAILHPTEGRMLGLVLHSLTGEEQLLKADDFSICGAVGAVLAEGHSLADAESLKEALSGGVQVCRELIGASVITDAGRLLGRVSEVHILEEQLWSFYRVAGSKLQELFGGGFFIASNVPRAWSHRGSRLIVPANTPQRQAVSSLAEAISAFEHELACAGKKL